MSGLSGKIPIGNIGGGAGLEELLAFPVVLEADADRIEVTLSQNIDWSKYHEVVAFVKGNVDTNFGHLEAHLNPSAGSYEYKRADCNFLNWIFYNAGFIGNWRLLDSAAMSTQGLDIVAKISRSLTDRIMFDGFVWSHFGGLSIFECAINAAPNINLIRFVFTNTRKFRANTTLVVVGRKK
jgi:hypothetical protein